ncbi:Uncharacterised protein [Leminorella richardii]|uniref:Uncharacterized protein n=1 Tax=Leminorella richardii TaxID=158841 RepID=A0A2X4UXQ0_9GAMM|nr:Uncharacterised protein [Leminorella richardii]
MYPYGPFTLGIDCAFALKTRICPDFLRHFFSFVQRNKNALLLNQHTERCMVSHHFSHTGLLFRFAPLPVSIKQ